MDGCDEEVEPQTPVGQPGEVAEGLADGDGVIMCAIPGPDDDDGGEDVEGDEGAQSRESGWREEPGCFEVVVRVEGWVDAEESRWEDSAHGDILCVCFCD